YKKYNKLLPSNLAKLLQLWDFICLPHEEHKQVFGRELPIIRLQVELNLMHICMLTKTIIGQ
ncbi:hypothetical protein PAXRUDRAFT_176672, partial [Paxillus rubicundulus Ve08.2h10]